MGSVIVVMPKTEDAKKLAGALKSRGINVDLACSRGSDALRLVNSRDYGVVVSGFRMQDMSHIDILGYLPKYFEMVLITSESKLDSCAEEVVKVTLPIHIPLLVEAVNQALGRVERQVRHDKKGPGSRSEEDRKLIEDAQKILMDTRGMGRIESYRYIQKRSMDDSVSMLDIANKIIEEGY